MLILATSVPLARAVAPDQGEGGGQRFAFFQGKNSAFFLPFRRLIYPSPPSPSPRRACLRSLLVPAEAASLDGKVQAEQSRPGWGAKTRA